MTHIRIVFYAFACAAVMASASVADNVYVSRHAAKILPHNITTIVSPDSGELRILNRGEGRLPVDTHLALVNEDKLLIEEREAELSIRQQRQERDKAVQALRKQKEELLFLQKLPPERRAFAQERLKTTVDERVMTFIDEEIAIADERFRLAEERTRKSAQRMREASTLRMPYDGRLQYHIPLPEEEDMKITIPASTPIATVIDDSAFYVVLAATDPSWSKLEHERLQLVVNLGGGETLKAHWHHQKVDKGERGESLFYYFILPDSDRDKAFALLGANIVAELFYRKESDWIYISKARLAREAGERTIETWEQLVDTLRPGYSIVFIGETHLCLRKTDERAALPAPVPAS